MKKLRIRHNTASDKDCYCLDILEEGNVHPIAYMQATSEELGGGGNQEVLRNAHEICRAVNSHAALVRALECAKMAMEDDPDCTIQYDIVCDALLLAKGE